MCSNPAPIGRWPIVQATLEPYCLPLRRPWASARGALSARRGWLVRVACAEGLEGLGDCSPPVTADDDRLAAAGSWLEAHRTHLVGPSTPELLDSLPPGPPEACSALEGALLDLTARAVGLPLRRILTPRAADRVRVNAALGTLEKGAAERAAEAVAAGHEVLKLKVGLQAPASELQALERLARTLPPGILLRLDANQAWSPAEAAAFVAGCAGLPVESLEEPLADPDPAGLARLQERATFPLAADESLARLDPAALLGSVRRLVLKLPLLGGFRRALRIARQAHAASVACVVTTNLESAVGGWAAAQLAAAVDPGAKLAHGLATGAWLADDLAAPPQPEHGWLSLPAAPGLGL